MPTHFFPPPPHQKILYENLLTSFQSLDQQPFSRQLPSITQPFSASSHPSQQQHSSTQQLSLSQPFPATSHPLRRQHSSPQLSGVTQMYSANSNTQSDSSRCLTPSSNYTQQPPIMSRQQPSLSSSSQLSLSAYNDPTYNYCGAEFELRSYSSSNFREVELDISPI